MNLYLFFLSFRSLLEHYFNAMTNNNTNNINNNVFSQTSFQFVDETQEYCSQHSAGSRRRGRPSVVAPTQGHQAPAPTPTPVPADSQQQQEQDETSYLSYDSQSQWVLFDLFRERYVRLETSTNTAAKDRLYNEIYTLYNQNPNVNAKRNLRSIKNKWTDMLRIYRRRKDQQSRTGEAGLKHWEFHDAMKDMAAEIATVVPPTVY